MIVKLINNSLSFISDLVSLIFPSILLTRSTLRLCLFQIRVDGIPPPAQNALLYETVTVFEGKPILRDMVFSPDHEYIYLLSDRQVSAPVESPPVCLQSSDRT